MTHRALFVLIVILAVLAHATASTLRQSLTAPADLQKATEAEASPATATVPPLIAFNGIVQNRDGATNGVIGLTFALYKDQVGGAPLWIETQNVQLDAQGRYNVLLGVTQATGLPTDLFVSGQTRWLGVRAQIPGEEEQLRIVLVSVPYALKAADADTIGGKPASAFVLAQTDQPDSEFRDVVKGKLSGESAHVNPKFSATGTGTGTPNRSIKWTDASGTLGDASVQDNGTGVSVAITPSNNVGIGTTNPNADFAGPILHAYGTQPAFVLQNTAGIAAKWDIGANWDGSGAFLSTRINGSPDLFAIRSNGNVGIGTTNPAVKLDVVGDLKVEGGITANTVTATAFSGNGSGLTNVNATALGGQPAASFLTRGITYLGGCDSCGVLADTDDQRTIYFNVVGSMTINSVTCFSDAGTPIINIQRDTGSGSPANVLASDLTCSTSGVTSTNMMALQSILNLNDKLDFVMVTAGGVAKRVTVAIKATVN